MLCHEIGERMREIAWHENPDWRNLEAVDIGDLVFLKFSDGFTYIVKLIVVSVNENEVSANVEALFDFSTEMPLTNGEVLKLENKKLTFKKKYIQKVKKA